MEYFNFLGHLRRSNDQLPSVVVCRHASSVIQLINILLKLQLSYRVWWLFSWGFFSTSSTSVNSRRTLSCYHLYLPWVRSTWHPDWVCAMVSHFLHSLQFGFLLRLHCCEYPGDGNVILQTSNDILNWLFLHCSFRVNSRSSSIFIQARCFPS